MKEMLNESIQYVITVENFWMLVSFFVLIFIVFILAIVKNTIELKVERVKQENASKLLAHLTSLIPIQKEDIIEPETNYKMNTVADAYDFANIIDSMIHKAFVKYTLKEEKDIAKWTIFSRAVRSSLDIIDAEAKRIRNEG